ncbi:MAG: peptidylprolyl isomerase [Clostridia bacterium]|jgi:peptidyl-prolyl cis-trans isomerase B (cyclophilin B)|nr:peptidylprolyl isomerase [Clostridia bacterium]MBT7123457.1 peptidylprolyl isomerase [Clostridia bacterium]
MVTIEMQSGKKIEIELSEQAPNTSANFRSLAADGFYDGLIFHRVIKGFMIQGGCPKGKGTGGPGYSIKGEFSANGFDNKIKHTKGVISMARSSAMDSAGSQFFIMHEDSFFLDGQYAAFGKVVSGQDVVDEIATTQTDAADRPSEPQKIKNITLSDDEVVDSPETV